MMINKIILGHALTELPKLPAESVSCVTTSPPYWSLRDYGVKPVIWDGDKNCKHIWGNEYNQIITKQTCYETGRASGDAFAPGKKLIEATNGKVSQGQFCLKCVAWRGSLGLEPTFELYIKHLCDIFDEVKRVLRKDGTCWVNIGDSYANTGTVNKPEWKHKETIGTINNKVKTNLPSKSLCLIPQRFAIEMVNRGWILRNTLIWHKPNCMPSSAKDRFTVDYEPVFFFSKSNKALFWTNEKTLECVGKSPLGTKGTEGEDWEWRKDSKGEMKKYSFWAGHDYWFEQQFDSQTGTSHSKGSKLHPPIEDAGIGHKDWHKYTPLTELPNGRNKRAVWTIPTQPFPSAHFAVYPEELIEIPIKAGCPEFICKKCGKARVKILDNSERVNTRPGLNTGNMKSGKDVDPNKELHKSDLSKYRQQIKYKELGYTDCGCNAGWESGINLDPFMGAGTTALVALKQRKRFIGIEIKQEYINMSYKRIAQVQQEIF